MYEVKSTCSSCGREVNRNAARCPYCGVKFSGERWINGKPSQSKSFTLSEGEEKILAVVSVLVALSIPFVGLIPPLFLLKNGQTDFSQKMGRICLVIAAIITILTVIIMVIKIFGV